MTDLKTMPERLALPEAAAALSLTWAQAYNLLLAGRLKGEKIGSRWFVYLPLQDSDHGSVADATGAGVN